MSHPNPGHDRSNEYPSDGYRPGSKSRALKVKQNDGIRAALKREHANVKRIMSGKNDRLTGLTGFGTGDPKPDKSDSKSRAIKSKMK